jgi:hypothetical protein
VGRRQGRALFILVQDDIGHQGLVTRDVLSHHHHTLFDRWVPIQYRFNLPELYAKAAELDLFEIAI